MLAALRRAKFKRTAQNEAKWLDFYAIRPRSPQLN